MSWKTMDVLGPTQDVAQAFTATIHQKGLLVVMKRLYEILRKN